MKNFVKLSKIIINVNEIETIGIPIEWDFAQVYMRSGNVITISKEDYEILAKPIQPISDAILNDLFPAYRKTK